MHYRKFAIYVIALTQCRTKLTPTTRVRYFA